MSNKQKKHPHKTLRDLLRTNTQVPKLIIDQYNGLEEKLEKYNELERQLEKLGIGIEPKPRYTLSPIFGGIGPTIKG